MSAKAFAVTLGQTFANRQSSIKRTIKRTTTRRRRRLGKYLMEDSPRRPFGGGSASQC